VVEFLGLKPHVPKEFAAWNKQDKPKLDNVLRKRLEAEFAADISDLQDLLNRDMRWQ
jgi:hypothetical protein